MAAPLRSLRSNFPSSSQFGSHLRRKSTSARSMAACSLTTRPPASFTRPRGAATGFAGARAVPGSDFGMGAREPRTRLFSAAAAPLFGDTIIVTKRCAQVNATASIRSIIRARCTLLIVSGRYYGSYTSLALLAVATPSAAVRRIRWNAGHRPPPPLVSGPRISDTRSKC